MNSAPRPSAGFLIDATKPGGYGVAGPFSSRKHAKKVVP